MHDGRKMDEETTVYGAAKVGNILCGRGKDEGSKQMPVSGWDLQMLRETIP